MMKNGTIDTPAIALVGVGAAGAALAAALLPRLEPYTTLVVIDRDVVTPPNLATTPLFTRADLGRPKAHAAADQLRLRRTGIRIVPVHQPVETLGAGPFLRSDLTLVCLDNRAAKFHANRAAQLAGAPALWGELEGGLSAAYRVRYRDAGPRGPCLECGWSAQDYALLARLNAPCAAAQGDPPSSGAQRGPAAALAAEMAALAAAFLAGERPLAPGEERRVVPQAAARLRLVTRPRPDCLCPHGRPALVRLSGPAAAFTVADLIAAIDPLFGVTRWAWRLPAPVRLGRCEDCGAATGWAWPARACPAACPACGSPRILCGREVAQLGRAELLPLAGRALAALWPAGDIIEVCRADGRRRIHLALPADDLWDCLCRPTLPAGGSPCRR